MSFTLPQNESRGDLVERHEKLGKTRAEYEWGRDIEGLPPCVKQLPRDKAVDFNTRNLPSMFISLAEGWWNRHRAYINRYLKELSLIEHYRSFYLPSNTPSVASRWQQDAEFGRQRLAGVNPAFIQVCRKLPENLPVTEAQVAGLLGPAHSLRSLADHDRLYITDYWVLEGIPAQAGRRMPAPISLLWVDDDDDLMPIAAQLSQTPGPEAPIFTPEDDRWLWTYVKMHCQSADAAYHEVAAHLLQTHLVMETFEVSMRRNVSERHPLNELLTPHFEATLGINTAARESMLVEGGPIDIAMAAGVAGSLELMARIWKDYNWQEANLNVDLQRRGVEDASALPNYHYRDDSRLLYGTIGEFVSGIVRHFYRSDEDVQHDTELRAWLRELAEKEDAGGAGVRGLPNGGELLTRLELVEFLTQIVFTCSAQHAAVNNGQYDLFGFVPNVPGHLLEPPPTNRDPMTEEQVVRALPYKKASEEQIGFTEVLSTPTKLPLGQYPASFFDGDRQIHEHVARFQNRLQAVGEMIDGRNARLKVPYTYLHPRGVAQSIEI
jgi:hypothetical protein